VHDLTSKIELIGSIEVLENWIRVNNSIFTMMQKVLKKYFKHGKGTQRNDFGEYLNSVFNLFKIHFYCVLRCERYTRFLDNKFINVRRMRHIPSRLRFDDCKLAIALFHMFRFQDTKDKNYKMRIQSEYFEILELITFKKYDPVDRFFYFRTHFMVTLYFKDSDLSWNISNDSANLGKQMIIDHKKQLLKSVINAFKVRKASVPEKYIQITEN
jgi:hypothetical protein